MNPLAIRLVIRVLAGCFLALCTARHAGLLAGESAPPPVNVILWFDTEDYLLPASDDAAKHLAEMLTARGIRATFKVVGEKARVLQRRGRTDVIAALNRHEIGYHSDFHSVHPAPSEYLAHSGLLDGMAEFIRREGDGAADVRRIFGRTTLVCYGQPGSSWAPQTMAALKAIGVAPRGVPCYVDEGSHVGLDNRPFWYAGALTVYHMGQNFTRMDLHDPGAVGPACDRFDQIVKRLRAGRHSGLISIYYHPCEWVHREFWDGVNFRRGANPPREDWRPPRQRPAAETKDAFRRFGQYLDHMHGVPDVRFITAADLPWLYPDWTRSEGATSKEADRLAEGLLAPGKGGIDFQVLGRNSFSAADQFELFAHLLATWIGGREPRWPSKLAGLLGPARVPPASREKTRLDWPAFRDAVLDVDDFIRKEKRIPSGVYLGPRAVPPADFLVGMASAYRFYRRNGHFPVDQGVRLGHQVAISAERHVAPDSPRLFGGWIIHEENFRAPKILEMARLQAWSLKPALSRE